MGRTNACYTCVIGFGDRRGITLVHTQHTHARTHIEYHPPHRLCIIRAVGALCACVRPQSYSTHLQTQMNMLQMCVCVGENCVSVCPCAGGGCVLDFELTLCCFVWQLFTTLYALTWYERRHTYAHAHTHELNRGRVRWHDRNRESKPTPTSTG